SSTGMVLNRSLVSQKTDRRRAFEKIVLICRNIGCFCDDRLRWAANECAVVARAWDVSCDDEKSGRKTEIVHDRHCYAKLINRTVVIRERHCSIFPVLPFRNLCLTDLSGGETRGNNYCGGQAHHIERLHLSSPTS